MTEKIKELLQELGKSYSIEQGELYYYGDPLTGRVLLGYCTEKERELVDLLNIEKANNQ